MTDDRQTRKAFESFIGFAMTCKQENTDEWMKLFRDRMQAALDALGVDGTVRLAADGFEFGSAEATP